MFEINFSCKPVSFIRPVMIKYIWQQALNYPGLSGHFKRKSLAAARYLHTYVSRLMPFHAPFNSNFTGDPMRPFLKWAGGKYRLVERIKTKLPQGLRLLEPFAGSCALSLNTDYQSYWLNDINADLINLYQVLQKEGTAFIEYCGEYFIPENNIPEKYYELRKQFNQETDIYIKSALFIYLNRHGYNGLSRYNAGGEFNVPFGKYAKPYFPEKELIHFHTKFKTAKFTSVDFETMMSKASPGDLIYCDPPYEPLTETSNFTSYSAGGFGREEQERLAKIAAKTAAKGIPVLISNHRTDFIMDIYQTAKAIEVFPVRRFISCDGNNRNSVEEILALF
jgi:DNA adenine methylase